MLFVSCGQKSGNSPKPREIPEDLIGIQDLVAVLDSVGGQRLPASAEGRQAQASWDRFKQQCNEGRFEDALNFALGTDEKSSVWGDLILFLGHSSLRAPFLTDVLMPLLYTYKEDSLATEESFNRLQLERYMEEATAEISEDGILPDSYPDVLMNLGPLYAQKGQLEEAKTLIPKLAAAIAQQYPGDSVYPEYVTAIYLSQMYASIGDADEVRKAWERFKQEVRRMDIEKEAKEFFCERADENLADMLTTMNENE